MKKFLLLFILSFLFTQQLPAQQKQGAWWYFGNKAGLNFNTEPPSPDFAGQGISYYGCASVSDSYGNLLFYIDGNSVLNRQHQVMPNGANIPLSGGNGQTNVMIVQKPGSTYLFYLFAATRFDNVSTSNFTYSVIDMRMDGGKGDIISTAKKVLVFTGSVVPKFTAAMHTNNQNVWVIAHSRVGNTFYSFPVSASGIGQPVISSVGFTYTSANNIGVLKSSPNSTLVADAISNAYLTQLLDFDRTSGVLTNARSFNFVGSLNYAYGAAFSPNGTKLYLSDILNVYQYDLLAGSFQNVLASQTVVSTNPKIWHYDIQLGMNGKLYLIPEDTLRTSNNISNKYLSTINCPNAIGSACGFQDTAIYIGRTGGLNLPALNQTLFRNANFLQVAASQPYVCIGDSIKLSAFGAGADHFTWLPAAGLQQNNGSEVSISPAATTTYTVIGYSQCSSDTVSITVPVVPPAFANAGPDKIICTSGSVQLGVPAQPGLTYTWNNVAGISDTTLANPVFTALNNSGSVQVFELILKIDGPGATCGKPIDTVRVTVQPQILVNAGQNLTTCSGNSVTLNPQLFNGSYSYSWSPATGLSNTNTFAPTLTVTNTSAVPDTLTYTLYGVSNGCSASSQVRVVILPAPLLLLSGPASICPGSPQIAYHVQNPLPGNSYTWGVRGGSLSQNFGDSIWVNWGAASATASVWAIGQNSFNCPGDTVFFPVMVNALLQTEKPKGSATLCENDKQSQLYQVARAQGSVYSWGISGGVIISGQGSHGVRVNLPGPGQYKLWVQESAQTSLAQCYGVSDTLYITVLPSPDNTLAVQGPASVCAQSQQIYSLAGNGNSAYQWQVMGGNILSGQGSNSILINWQTVGQGEVKVRETLANGCAGNWRTLAVLVNPLPQLVVNSTNYFCPEALTQTHRVQGLPGSTFQWQVSGGSLVSGQGSSQAVILWDSLVLSHSFTVTETSIAGCSSAPQQVAVTFDRSALHLLSVGLNEAKTQLVVVYALKNLPQIPQNQVIVQVKDSQTPQWQQLGQRSATDTIFQAPAGVFEAQDYRLQFQNTCGNEIYSGVHRPVKLKAAGQENSGEVTLSWNPYKGWSGTVRYEVWRQLESQPNFEKMTVTTDSSLILKSGRDGFRQRYRIKAVSATGRESWSQSVVLEFRNELVFPNIITPNNDGLNDFFTAKNLPLYPNSRLKIFNRWGQEVFSIADYRGNWQAEGLSSGTYYYLLQTASGTSFKGWVEVMR